jgi:hypothetical protein
MTDPARSRRTIVCICGSMKFEQLMLEAAREESAAGRIVVMPLCNLKQPHHLWQSPLEAARLKAELDGLHRAKIDLADEVLVVSDHTGYYGESTHSEISYARQLGKPLRYWTSSLNQVPLEST